MSIWNSEGKLTQVVLLKSFSLSVKKGNSHVALNFTCPTKELKDYSDKLLNRNLFQVCKKAKSDEERKLSTVTKSYQLMEIVAVFT